MYFKLLSNRTIYVFESNHDIEMLMNNPHYPHHIKNRIMGDKGHLSNKDSAYYLSKFIGNKTKKVILYYKLVEKSIKVLLLNTIW